MRIKLYSLFIIMALATACQKELSTENTPGGGTGNGGGGTGGGGGGTQTNDCKSCVYIPMCNGSIYTYNDTISGAPQISNDTLKFIKDTLISNKTFQKFLSTGQSAFSYTNCTNGESRVIGYNNITNAGNTVSKVDIIFLKANLPVNGTWSDTVLNPLNQQVIYNSTIIEKGVSRTVNGKTFSDVIFVSVEIGVEVPLIGFFPTNTSDYYYARGVGIIEYIGSDFFTGSVIQHRAIKSYFIP